MLSFYHDAQKKYTTVAPMIYRGFTAVSSVYSVFLSHQRRITFSTNSFCHSPKMDNTSSAPNPTSSETTTQQSQSRGPKTNQDGQTSHRDLDLYLGGRAITAALQLSDLRQECQDLFDPPGDGPLPYISPEESSEMMAPKYQALESAESEVRSAHSLRALHRAQHNHVSIHLKVFNRGHS